MNPTFDSLPNAAGFELVDPIDSRRFEFLSHSSVTLDSAPKSAFRMPVETTRRTTTTGLTIPQAMSVTVRRPTGESLDTIDPHRTEQFGHDEYLLELHAPLKVYLRVESATRITIPETAVRIEFDAERSILVGARSYHTSPSATITVPDDPEALLTALSALPSSLKTTSPEQSWPTLRGHPPRLERGDELHVPDRLEPPDTGIEVSVPPEYGYLYPVAPLAFYLGAEVVAGDPAVRTNAGVVRSLGDTASDVTESVEDLLTRVFFLDCVVRTEGNYPVELAERRVVESKTDLDLETLYDASLADRLAAYLSVPDPVVEEIASPWHRTTYVRPNSDAIDVLSAIVDDLSLVGVRGTDEQVEQTPEADERIDGAIESLFRRRRPDPRPRATDRSPGIPNEVVPLPDGECVERAFVGERTPTNGTKLLPSAFESRATPTADPAKITVVCNDEEMREEGETVTDVYGGRSDVPITVEAAFDVSVADLRSLLADDSRLFHFVGHIDGAGLKCHDGVLDATTVEETGANVVFLNGCRSHDQGLALVEAGASAAIVSLASVWSDGAGDVGETIARLLRHGFSVASTVELVREHHAIGHEYVTVGDPGTTVLQEEHGMPVAYRIGTDPEDGVAVEPVIYPVSKPGAGIQAKDAVLGIDNYHVVPGTCGQTIVGEDVLKQKLPDVAPLIVDGRLTTTEEWFQS